jgi:hypothetical protein
MKKFLSTLFALKFIVLLGAIGGTMLWVGLTKLGNARQSFPKRYHSVDEIRLDGRKWVKIKNGSLDILASAYLDDADGGKIEEIFIPVKSSKSTSPEFYLRTKDSKLLSIFNLHHSLVQMINMDRTNIEMARNDPKYLKFLKTTIPELEKEIEKSEAELEFYRKKYKSVNQSFKGMLDLEFDNNEKYKMSLGSNVHIIKHNEKPETGFYPWFLTVVGVLISLLSLLSLISFFIKDKSNA